MNEIVGYEPFFASVKERIASAQVKTVVAANSQMLWLYWQLGDHILQNQNTAGWGAKVIDKLSVDIHRAFPLLKGFSARNLKYMRKFAQTYPYLVWQKYIESVNWLKESPEKVQQVIAELQSEVGAPIVQQVVAQIQSFDNESFNIKERDRLESLFLETIIAKISWAHHVILMDKANTMVERFWYMINTLEHGISRNVLAIQIESGLFERQVKTIKTSNFQDTLPAPQTDFTLKRAESQWFLKIFFDFCVFMLKLHWN